MLEATGGPPAARYALAAIAADLGAELVPDALEAVEADRRVAGTRASGLVGYDALLIAVGARPGPRLPGALRFAGARDAAALRAALEGARPARRGAVRDRRRRRLDAAALRARAADRRAPPGVRRSPS